MKKLLILLLALLLGCGMAAAEEAYEPYTGLWELRTLSLLGREMGAEELGYPVFLSFHDDDTCLLSMGEAFVVARLQYAKGQCLLQTATEAVPLIVDEQGEMSLSLKSDGLTMTLQLVPGEAEAVLPELLPFTGLWTLVRMEVGGTVQTVGANAGFTLQIYDDCAGLLTRLDESADMFRLVSVEGTAALLDMQGRAFPVTLEAGQLRFATPLGDSEVRYVLNRVGEAPVIAEAGQDAAAENEGDEAVADADHAVEDEALQAGAAPAETTEPAETEAVVQKRVVVTADMARVRQKPDISADQVKVAYKGDSFVYLDEIPNWYIIECNGRKAYIHMGVTAIE